MKFSAIFLSLWLMATSIVTVSGAASAQVVSCRIKVVGGAFKGHSMKIKMQNGEFVGDSSIKASKLEGCRGMKYFYGRWYHMCEGGSMIVFKQKKGKWVRLQPKSLKKYIHNCF